MLLMEMCHEQLLNGLPMLSSLVLLNKVAKMKPWVRFYCHSFLYVALPGTKIVCSLLRHFSDITLTIPVPGTSERTGGTKEQISQTSNRFPNPSFPETSLPMYLISLIKINLAH